ncbi:MAG TPA: cupin domain-containing protein [Ramlibacter sp.]|nr:cupin domain-containing protein [Ramlibacter sp.]
MNTIDTGATLAASRVARYDTLRPLPVQTDPSIPQEALDVIYSRRLLPVLGLEGGAETAVSTAAPIVGAAGITITLAVCPPGQGPGLHAHKATFETFTVLQGSFEFRWGPEGEHTARLERFDTFSFPPGIQRAFRNVGETEGILQVVISGGRHDASDIQLPPSTTAALKAASPKLFDKMAAAGITCVP